MQDSFKPLASSRIQSFVFRRLTFAGALALVHFVIYDVHIMATCLIATRRRIYIQETR